jgi:hypothetical protein
MLKKYFLQFPYQIKLFILAQGLSSSSSEIEMENIFKRFKEIENFYDLFWME